MTKSKKGLGFTILRIVVSFVFFIIAQIFTSILLELLPLGNTLLLAVFSYTPGVILFVFLIWIYLHFVEHRNLSDIGFPLKLNNFFNLAFGLLLGAIAILLSAIPLYLTGQYKIYLGEPNIYASVIGLILFISVGFNEELLCRGVMQYGFLRYGPIAAVSLTSTIFSLLHFSNPNITILPFLNLILAGLFMGVVVYATGNIWASIGVHITWNWVQGSILGIPVSGQELEGLFTTQIIGNNPLWTGNGFGAEGSLSCTIVLTILIIITLLISKRNGKYNLFLEKMKDERTK